MGDGKDYRCKHCGKWAVAEHTFRQMLTCIYGGSPLKDGGTWDQATSDAVTERIANRAEQSVGGDTTDGESR